MSNDIKFSRLALGCATFGREISETDAFAAMDYAMECGITVFDTAEAYHHFKYAPFRRPGEVHIHFFGTATLSFADGVRTQRCDIFEIKMAAFGAPLRNRLAPVNSNFAYGDGAAL